jgi:hypothetical protein
MLCQPLDTSGEVILCQPLDSSGGYVVLAVRYF